MNISVAEKKSTPAFVFISKSEAETFNLARTLGEALKGGDWIALIGELGTGKTAFVKGLGEALHCPEEPRSPTFVLIQHYAAKPGRLALRHVDLYRLGPEEIPHLEWDDLLTVTGVTVVEWADRARHLWPRNCLSIRITHGGGDLRTFEFFSDNPRAAELVKKLKTRPA